MNINNIMGSSRMNYNFTNMMRQRSITSENKTFEMFQPTTTNRADLMERFNGLLEKMDSIDVSMDLSNMTSEELTSKVTEIKELRGGEMTQEMSDEEMRGFIEKFAAKKERLSAKLKSLEEHPSASTKYIHSYQAFDLFEERKEQFLDRLNELSQEDIQGLSIKCRETISDYLEGNIV